MSTELSRGPDHVLAADTAMGPVTLRVADLDRMRDYYRDAIALDVLADGGDRVVLGRGGRALVVLQHAPELRHAPAGSAGLFHTAILYESPAALAGALYAVATTAPETFTGSADHLVSQAFYTSDPEGNGVELYWDRPRSEWTWTNGQVEMATLALDPNGYLQTHLTETGRDTPRDAALGGATVGHVHLSVGDVPSAQAFYVDALGFEPTATIGNQALFVSAGGYHHHMAMNVWSSRGAGPRMPALGLGRVDIVLPGDDDRTALLSRLAHAGVEVRDDGRTLRFEDPWRNALEVRTSAAEVEAQAELVPTPAS